MISATVVAHSVCLVPLPKPTPAVRERRVELVTYELVCPKWMVAEINTDRMKARNSASSRAMPLSHTISLVEGDPFIPSEWHYAQKGMTTGELMTDEDAQYATTKWMWARDQALQAVRDLQSLPSGKSAAKEHANRLLEPFMWTTVVMTATEWDNFFALRDNPAAQLEFRLLARAMKRAIADSKPVLRTGGGIHNESNWHLPYVTKFERENYKTAILPFISARRCAAVSYRRQGEPIDLAREIDKGHELKRNKHWSPLEMQCYATRADEWFGPFYSWKPLRKFYAGESGSPWHGTKEDDINWPR